MKKLIITGMFSLLSFGVFAQANTNVLPQNAQNFIQSNFSTATVESVQEESSWQFWDRDELYEVRLSNGIKLDFNKAGEVTEIDSKSGEAIPKTALPSAVVSYVEANYPNTEFNSWEKSDDEQEVELSNGTDLEFDAQGNFRKVD